ncbi:hypothetical protein [Methylibium sp.]
MISVAGLTAARYRAGCDAPLEGGSWVFNEIDAALGPPPPDAAAG